MKKILFTLLIAAGIFCFASCKSNQPAEVEAEATEFVDSTVVETVAVDSVAAPVADSTVVAE